MPYGDFKDFFFGKKQDKSPFIVLLPQEIPELHAVCFKDGLIYEPEQRRGKPVRCTWASFQRSYKFASKNLDKLTYYAFLREG